MNEWIRTTDKKRLNHFQEVRNSLKRLCDIIKVILHQPCNTLNCGSLVSCEKQRESNYIPCVNSFKAFERAESSDTSDELCVPTPASPNQWFKVPFREVRAQFLGLVRKITLFFGRGFTSMLVRLHSCVSANQLSPVAHWSKSMFCMSTSTRITPLRQTNTHKYQTVQTEAAGMKHYVYLYGISVLQWLVLHLCYQILT